MRDIKCLVQGNTPTGTASILSFAGLRRGHRFDRVLRDIPFEFSRTVSFHLRPAILP